MSDEQCSVIEVTMYFYMIGLGNIGDCFVDNIEQVDKLVLI